MEWREFKFTSTVERVKILHKKIYRNGQFHLLRLSGELFLKCLALCNCVPMELYNIEISCQSRRNPQICTVISICWAEKALSRAFEFGAGDLLR